MQVKYFQQLSGKEPVREYIDALSTAEAAAVMAVLEDLEVHGLKNSLVDSASH